ncbi:hypothetical protein PG995_006539 [Apiospora arundinis]
MGWRTKQLLAQYDWAVRNGNQPAADIASYELARNKRFKGIGRVPKTGGSVSGATWSVSSGCGSTVSAVGSDTSARKSALRSGASYVGYIGSDGRRATKSGRRRGIGGGIVGNSAERTVESVAMSVERRVGRNGVRSAVKSEESADERGARGGGGLRSPRLIPLTRATTRTVLHLSLMRQVVLQRARRLPPWQVRLHIAPRAVEVANHKPPQSLNIPLVEDAASNQQFESDNGSMKLLPERGSQKTDQITSRHLSD